MTSQMRMALSPSLNSWGEGAFVKVTFSGITTCIKPVYSSIMSIIKTPSSSQGFTAGENFFQYYRYRSLCSLMLKNLKSTISLMNYQCCKILQPTNFLGSTEKGFSFRHYFASSLSRVTNPSTPHFKSSELKHLYFTVVSKTHQSFYEEHCNVWN